jgi:uncharacterized protein YjeT (DUF2065 family)
MKRTHLSFYYLIGYLIPSGLALLLVPQVALKLLFSSGAYGDLMPRVVGIFALVLGILVLQIVRFRIEKLYTTIIAVRAVILVVLFALYLYSLDPLFLSLMVVVGFGFVLSSTCYWLDTHSK